MPELPEVEITRLGLLKRVKGRVCTGAVVRETRFRKPAQSNLSEILSGQTLLDIERRGKYLIWRFERGFIFSHLGMSGVLRVYPRSEPPVKHDHIDLCFGDLLVRYHDPRRFGFLVWYPEGTDAAELPEIQRLGVEPFSEEFTADYLWSEFKKRRRPVKEVLLSGEAVVGVGNIYCSESLFHAGISPFLPADKITKKQALALRDAVRSVLSLSLQEGGSTLKDFRSAEGEEGYFTLNAKVYGRQNMPCCRCGTLIQKAVQGSRATYYCPKCQKK
jgi:formamidopyrimidine-DNA glycosylase